MAKKTVFLLLTFGIVCTCNAFDVDLSASNCSVDRGNYLHGSHTSLADPPRSTRRVMTEIIKNYPEAGSLKEPGTAALRASGHNALRFYDAAYMNYRSAIEAAIINNRIWGNNYSIPPDDDHYYYPYYDEIIDYCAEKGFVCVMVLDTWYYDPTYDTLYDCKEVCNNCPNDTNDPYYTTNPDDPNGILYKAVARNVAPIAQYYTDQGYTSGLIFEIGNEGIERIDPNKIGPTTEQYGRMIKAYATAVKQINPNIKMAFYQWPTDSSIYQEITDIGCDDVVDYAVIHVYAEDYATMDYHITNTIASLDAAGLNDKKILLTEYNTDLWSTEARSYSKALLQCKSEFVMASNPRVEGMFEHELFGTKVAHSNSGYLQGMANPLWSLIPTYGVSDPVYGHPADSYPAWRQGNRFRYMATALTGRLFGITLKGKLIQYWPPNNDAVCGIMTQKGITKRIMLLNPSIAAQPLTWSGSFADVQKQYLLTSVSDYFNFNYNIYDPNDYEQPWQIVETDGGTLPVSMPAQSVLVVELTDYPDVNGDTYINLFDVKDIALHWLENSCSEPLWCSGCDINKDGIVNLEDLAYIALYWLQ